MSGIGVTLATHLRHARTAMRLDGAVKDAEDNVGDVNLQHDTKNYHMRLRLDGSFGGSP